MRLNANSLVLKLVTGRTVIVPLVRANCGATGERMRLECPLCGLRVCMLYYLEPRFACRRCNGLRYAAQRTSSYGRKALAKRKVRRKWRLRSTLGGSVPTKAARHVAADVRSLLCGPRPYRTHATNTASVKCPLMRHSRRPCRSAS
jgi:hypothetical protein